MSSASLRPLAEHVYNVLTLNENPSTQITESKIQGLKMIANNIHFLARTQGGIDVRPDQISITNTVLSTGEVRKCRIVVFFHSEDGRIKRLIDAVYSVDGVKSANDVLAQLLYDVINKGF